MELFNVDKINVIFFIFLLIFVMLKIILFLRVVFKIRCVVKSINDFFFFLIFICFLLIDVRIDIFGVIVNFWLIGFVMVFGLCIIIC